MDSLISRSPIRAFTKQITETFIEHQNFVRVRDELIDCIADFDPGQPSLCVTGYGRTGKSTLCKKIKEAFPDEKDAVVVNHPSLGKIVADRIPILVVEVPDEPTAVQMGHQVLKAFKDPNWFRGDKKNVERRIDIFLDQCETVAVLFDEAHNIVDRSGTFAMEGIADWLKKFHNQTGKFTVLLGLPRLDLFFKYNEQLRWRYGNVISLDTYRWGPDELGDDYFAGLLNSFQERLPIPSKFDFSDEFHSKRFYYATSGIIGLLKKLLWFAVRIAARPEGPGAIDLDVLAAAFEAAVMKEFDRKPINPFLATYQGEPPPPLKSDSLTGIPRLTRRRMKMHALDMLSKT